MPESQVFGLAGLWAQGDFVIRTVALLLLAMSIASWYLILTRTLRLMRRNRVFAAVEAFWEAPDLAAGLGLLRDAAAPNPFAALAEQGTAAMHHAQGSHQSLSAAFDRSEFVTRALRQSMARSTARLEAGLTLLASIGATAPFVGLFGTVWGIYHALVQIGHSGAATLDRVAGPVGEALIMTAFGLFVAIPAVLAYNAFVRANRVELAELDAFAHDLHAWLTTGARIQSGTSGKA